MAETGLTDITGMEEELIEKACLLAMKAHESPESPFLVVKSYGSSKVVVSFPGSWSVNGWFANKSFGETEINRELFPSLKSVGSDQVAVVNKAFLLRFEYILEKLKIEVDNSTKERKQIVFTGHSAGAPIAILATIWCLEQKQKSENRHDNPPLCVTFGSPLFGNFIFSHALNREKWSNYFINFVMRYDIVPRILLSPLSQLEREFQLILDSFNPKSSPSALEYTARAKEASEFFVTVMRNASIVASHASCNLMGSSNLLLDTLTSFVQLTPYRPFGTYIFCTASPILVIVTNPDAVLQILFHSSQLTCEMEGQEVVYNSIKDHWKYENIAQRSLDLQHVVCLNKLEDLPLSSDGKVGENATSVKTALNDLGLSMRARLNLRAAGVVEKRKKSNQDKIDSEKTEIGELLAWLQDYRAACKVSKEGYYDTFRRQKYDKDFQANVKRYKLTGIWDQIIEMLKRYELPDGFEGRDDWVELGTRFRRILEPLDIANYYRHSKNDDTGPYLRNGRPKRYRFTQRWREHALKMSEPSEESSFWAEVEELQIITNGSFNQIKDRVLKLEEKMKKWYEKEEIGNDVFLRGSTFMNWWTALPEQHKLESCIARIVTG